VVKSIYYSVKQVSDTLLSSNGQAFRKAADPVPREGMWTIGFQTGAPGGDAAHHLGNDFVSVYVPTTPNPTSGFFLMLPRKDAIELDMSVDEALKYIISMGVVAPPPTGPAPGPRGPSESINAPAGRRVPFSRNKDPTMRTQYCGLVPPPTSTRSSPSAAGSIAGATTAA
jgi:uncharacterized membrane protein